MMHSPQFSVLVADILKPLDIGKLACILQHCQSMKIHLTLFCIGLISGVPCFAPAIKFLKGAGQGNIVSQVNTQLFFWFPFLMFMSTNCVSDLVILVSLLQCEQLESELANLLHQRRTMQRTCLDLIHTYATVTSQFPSNYVNQNRMYEWMCWLKEIVHDSSTKMWVLLLNLLGVCCKTFINFYGLWCALKSYVLQSSHGIEQKSHKCCS